VKKRTVALVFLGFVVALVGATLAVLRTRWAGEKICRAAASKVEAATGLRFAFDACRLDVLGLAIEIDQAKLSPPGRPPVFSAELVRGRLAAVQALGRQLHLERLTLVKPRVELSRAAGADEGGPAHCPPAFLSRFEIRHVDVRDGAVDLALGPARLRLEAIQIQSTPGRRSLRALAGAGRRTQVSVSTGHARLELPGRAFDAARSALVAEVAIDLAQAEISSAEVELGGARIGLSGQVTDLCDPRLDVQVTADGPVASLAALAGVQREASGTATLTVKVKGRPTLALAAPGRGRAVRGERTEVSAKLTTRGVRIGRFVAGDVDADLRLEGGALRIDRLATAVQGGAVVVRGSLQLARGLPFEGQLDLGGVNLNEILERVGVKDTWIALRLTGTGRLAGTFSPVQLAGEVDAEGHDFKVLSRSYKEGAGDPGVLAVERGRVEGKLRVDRDGVYFDGVRVKVGRGTLRTDAAVHFHRVDGFWARASGEADLDALGRIGTLPWGGMAAVEVRVGAAPYALPTVEARVRGTDLRFLDVSLGTAAADVRFEKPALRIAVGEGSWESVQYRGDVALDLVARPMRLSASLRARGRARDLCTAVLDRIPSAQILRDAVDGEAELTGTARGPAAEPDLDFEVQLGAGTLYARRFDGGRVAGRIRALQELRLSQAELRRAGGTARASGSWSLVPPHAMKLDLDFQGLPLADLWPAKGLGGVLGGSASLGGTLARPRILLAAAGTGATWRSFPVGAPKLEARVEAGAARLALDAEGLHAEGEVVLAGRYPFRGKASAALDDALRLAGGAPPALRLNVGGAVEAEGDLLDWRLAHVDARVDRLQASYSDVRIEAAAPARLTAARGRWELQPLTLQGPNTSLTLRGARLASGELDASADGAFDLRLLSVLVPTLRRSSGQLGLQARFSGTVAEPLVVGTGKVLDAAFQVKGASVAVEGVGGVVAFSQNKVIFDQLDATVNGGKARCKGEIELARLVPVRMRAEAVLDEIPVTLPSLVPATLSGRLEVAGAPESAALTGRLHVIRARYTSDVDLQASLLKRKAPAAPRPYDRAGEWLRLDVALAVDGDVRVDNDLVHGPVSGELTLTGTLAAPGVVGSLAMGRGSRAVFRGNEFELSHAVLDFTDRSRVAASLDVNGEARVREYQVFLHAFGTLAEPQVKLTSLPDLPEQDIVTLLSLGFTRRDSGAQGGVSGVATATAAQALLSASGLDEQLRRFLPAGGPIRDLSMRIVTGYSEETGQVEPRAEFESWLLRDRLRLRFQTPLGTGRGRKAQAEVRLGDHMALQYQWDDENLDVPAGDHGLDLKLRWDWTDEQ
jgi:translocation and assembly module TamB